MNPQWMHKEYFGKFDEARSLQQPLGIAYLAAVLEKAGHKVKLVDAAALQYDKDDVIEEIRSFGPNHVGISTTTASFSRAVALAKEVKTQFDLILSATEVGRFMLPLCSSLGWAFRCCGSTRIHPSVEA